MSDSVTSIFVGVMVIQSIFSYDGDDGAVRCRTRAARDEQAAAPTVWR